MENPGETPTDGAYDARIIIDIKDSTFLVSHTANIEMDQIYAIFVAAIEYMETVEFGIDPDTPRILN